MRSFSLSSLFFVVFLLSSSTRASSNGHLKPRAGARHINRQHSTLGAKNRRDNNAPFTNFVDGQGACGATNGPNDFIVALNSAEYNGGAHCFEMITIIINGKTAVAQITDECPGCGPGGLDLSEGLFKFFAPLDQGELYGSWYYNSDITSSSSTPAPTPTPTTPYSSSTAPTTMTTTSASTIPPSSSSSNTPTAPTSTPQDPEVIAQFGFALLEVGGLLQASFKLGI